MWKLNKTLRVANTLGLSGDAAEAQDRLCKLPERLMNIADSRPSIAEPVGFDWIYGEVA